MLQLLRSMIVDESLDNGEIVREDFVAFGTFEKISKVFGKRWSLTSGLLDRVGELGRMGGSHNESGHGVGPPSCRSDTDGGVRVKDHARFIVNLRDGRQGLFVGQARSEPAFLHPGQQFVGETDCPVTCLLYTSPSPRDRG